MNKLSREEKLLRQVKRMRRQSKARGAKFDRTLAGINALLKRSRAAERRLANKQKAAK